MLFLHKLLLHIKLYIYKPNTIKELEVVRINFIGKKGVISNLLKFLNKLSILKRSIFGIIVNESKQITQLLFTNRKSIIESLTLEERAKEEVDSSLPGRTITIGSLHPITDIISKSERFFLKLGFIAMSGIEIEDAFHNFEVLNIPKYHPSRTDHATFWLTKKLLLRTQASNMQSRLLTTQKIPIKVISSGRVYRNDYNKTHTPTFHQMEGFLVDKTISYSNLKTIVRDFIWFLFNNKINLRFRPSYFPFTILSTEVDLLSSTGTWIEVLGCGMIHPKILNNANISSNYAGLAFGIGIERLAMLYYNMNDIRLLYDNDLRFLKQC
ncbi:phenylalanine--tRNA ligase subunit alpha [Candidatus Tremblaya phenacola]|uniref:Phenylalanine--tRNA ligase alpha subunit n=1 Tax=Candidatus Tremblayella phenacoccinincola TaxID=1010676 RepID=A0A2G0V792_9PROT|nr:phenylalanine--tRNA ligase subunit alpha [Candidatus Tremblaya phenacola]PHN16340.1 Phenylalanine--tRNA ligase alpha subunit [Candidatus Tremblaya phenacola]